MRILVTGGAGFIGSNLVDTLLDAGHEVAVVDDLSTGRRENLAGALDRGAVLHEADISDPPAMRTLLAAERPDAVLHLAAQMDVRRSVADPAFDARVNVVGTAALLDAAHKADVRRFVLASTGGAIYGEADTIPTGEDAPLRPEAPYGAAKAAAESYLALYQRLHALSTLSLRLGNVYGPRQDPRGEAGVVALFCDAVRDGRPVTIYGDGTQTRDFIYVADVVDAFVAALSTDASGSLNIGTGTETSVRELASALGAESRLAPERPGEILRSCLDPGRAAEVLGWRAQIGMRDGLERTLDWMAAAA
jgi:UDP-glucose 4-epimerase